MTSVTIHPGGAAAAMPVGRGRRRAVGLWLLLVALLVFLMVVVGGITRLTESGLSIVDWRPVTGVVPPMSEAEWQAAFDAYKAYPEYKVLNRGMSLAEFKTIYWWEFGHRLLGRLIGLAFLIPLAYFWIRRRIPRGYKPRLVILFLLGGLQGLLGWFMVQSGLVSEPEVSHYRLTAHLLLAFVIFAALLWTALDLLTERHALRDTVLRRWARVLLGLVLLQAVLGGLVAGLKAGYVYNEWPLMDGRFFPAVGFSLTPVWRNFLDNAALVQFDHRIGAYLLVTTAAIVLWLCFHRRAPAPAKAGAILILVFMLFQATVGIFTVVHGVPIALGALHQAGGLVVLAGVVMFAHMYRKQEPGR